MAGPMRPRALLPPLALALALAACAGPTGSPVELPGGSGARAWGDGPYGLVLVPDAGHDAASWEAVARRFAEDGMTVLALDSAEPAAVHAGLRLLLVDRGLQRAALLGAGTGAEAAIEVALQDPGMVDQLIVLSARADVTGLAEFPKLFVASAGEPAAADAERMAAQAPGAWNELYLAPGDATGQAILDGEGAGGALEAIGRRLDERR